MTQKPRRRTALYVFVSLAVALAAVCVIMLLFPTTRPGAWNPENDSYYYNKYDDSGDTRACVDEWYKYHPSKGKITHKAPPCPGWPQ